MCLIATVNYPHVLGQFMAGQVGGTTCLMNAKCIILMYSRHLIMLFSSFACLGAIQVLRNADGGGGVSNFPEKSVTKV